MTLNLSVDWEFRVNHGEEIRVKNWELNIKNFPVSDWSLLSQNDKIETIQVELEAFCGFKIDYIWSIEPHSMNTVIITADVDLIISNQAGNTIDCGYFAYTYPIHEVKVEYHGKVDMSHAEECINEGLWEHMASVNVSDWKFLSYQID